MELTNDMSTQIIADRIYEELKLNNYNNFTLRPFNYFKPESTLWWIVPSTEWPSYKYGKLTVFIENGKYQVGMHIEKGVNGAASQMLTSKSEEKFIMKTEWLWNTLIEDIKSGVFGESLTRINESTGKDLIINIQASGISDRDSRVEMFDGLELDNTISYEFKSDRLSSDKDNNKGILKKYSNIDTSEKLAEIFDDSKLDWFWIDFFVVIEMETSDMNSTSKYALEFVKDYNELFI
jgi:hypothetical protein